MSESNSYKEFVFYIVTGKGVFNSIFLVFMNTTQPEIEVCILVGELGVV